MNRMMMAMVAAAMLAGCSTETRGTRVTVDTQTGKTDVVEANGRLAGKVRVAQVWYGETGGIKTATVTLESRTKGRYRFQARMVWLDAAGVEIDADGKSYRAIVLDGGDSTTVSGVAPNEKAQKVRMVIREMETVE